MTPSKLNHGYRGNTYTTHLCVVREGGLPPSKYSTPTFVKTSDLYVTYVTPVTDLKFFVFVLGWGSKGDRLSNEYGFTCPRVAGSDTPEPRRNSSERPSNILEVARAIFLVITVSPRRNIRATFNNYVGISGVFSFSQFQFCEGDYQ